MYLFRGKVAPALATSVQVLRPNSDAALRRRPGRIKLTFDDERFSKTRFVFEDLLKATRHESNSAMWLAIFKPSLCTCPVSPAAYNAQ